jgi:hypothetical protein
MAYFERLFQTYTLPCLEALIEPIIIRLRTKRAHEQKLLVDTKHNNVSKTKSLTPREADYCVCCSSQSVSQSVKCTLGNRLSCVFYQAAAPLLNAALPREVAACEKSCDVRSDVRFLFYCVLELLLTVLGTLTRRHPRRRRQRRRDGST